MARLTKYDMAREKYQEVIKTDAKYLPAYQGLARMQLKANQKDQALDTLKKAQAIAPKDAYLWYDLAMCHGCRKEWNEQVDCLNKALELQPDNRHLSKQLGFTLARMGRFDEAVSRLSQVYGGPAYAHYMVARMIHSAFGNEDAKCKQHLQEALRQNPNLREARDMLVALETPEASPATLAQPVTVDMQTDLSSSRSLTD